MKANSKIQLPQGVLRIKTGYNPNSSSIGTLVYSFPLALVALSVAMSFLASLRSAKKENADI